MKKILGLDLGTTSIGWALVNEAEKDGERSSIEKLGVRVNPLTVDEQTNFEKGKSITSNADRTLKRSMRRNLQRYKQRRDNLIEVLKEHSILNNDTVLSEEGNYSTFRTYENRASAATDQIPLEEFARILLMINKKRGYKSSRKAKGQDEGQLIDGMEVAKQLYEKSLTPGQFVYELLKEGKKFIPDFYRSDLITELNKIWEFQKQYHVDLLTEEFRIQLEGKAKTATSKLFLGKYKIYTAETKGTREEKKLQAYKWRAEAPNKELSKEELAFVIVEVNGSINSSSGYLGAISDRSKELFFNKFTVGQYLYKQIKENPNVCLKGQVFYRQDYLDEFETIWEKQAQHYSQLTPELKNEIRDIIIFYQRKLKSQKGLISFCEFESKSIELNIDDKKIIKTRGMRVIPKSSPLYQEFKIWQILNNLEITNKKTKEKYLLEQEDKERLFLELNWKERMTKGDVLRLLFKNFTELELNFKDVEGNRTNAAFLESYKKMAEISGHDIDFVKLNTVESIEAITKIFEAIGVKSSLFTFDPLLENPEFEKQPLFQLWHLIYSYEDDNSPTGNEKLLTKLKDKYGFEKEYALILSSIVFQADYGSLSSKAIRKIIPYLKEGNSYDVACTYAGYNHSNSLTKEQRETRQLKNKLDILSKNSLRNPVVEKILNQMVNVVNAVIEEYGKPEEIRIELARELKKSAKEREDLTKSMNTAKDDHERYRKILQNEFGLQYVSRNDIIRYKLYRELEYRGFKTLYTNTYVSPEKLFSKEFDIEHVIPQSRLFDDSFSNKILETRSANIKKDNATAYDFIFQEYGDVVLANYVSDIEDAYKKEKISRTKRNKLLMKGTEIPEGFIERDLRNTQYIAKKAKMMLEEVFREVNTTTGIVTDRLREDWQLIDVMQELNWGKYKALGLTYYEVNREGKQLPRIKDWTKRNDHRHHAMDALTVAFTKRSHVQYLNNLNARSDRSGSIYGIEQKELYRDERNKLRFKPPIPLNDFRAEAKTQLANTLVSYKAKNKVATININKIKGGSSQKVLTPRGQLHLETVYGSSKQYKTIEVKVGASFNVETIHRVAKEQYRTVLLKRLAEFNNDPKMAFSGKNTLEKNPIYLNELQTLKVPEKIKLVDLETVYTIRKEVSPDLNIDKVVDVRIRKILENRLVEFQNDPKKAFSNLDENPIWLNQAKGIKIKRVTLTGISNAIALHDKKDKEGKAILNDRGNTSPIDFINTGNNHHVAIYEDSKGELQEIIVSFYEAVERVNQSLPIINISYKQSEGWKFLFTMKQNEYFVFSNEQTGFDPKAMDLLNDNNYHLISPNLFRVQKLASKDYNFRHHLESQLINGKELENIIYKRLRSNSSLRNIVKIRINHLGKIIHIGEY